MLARTVGRDLAQAPGHERAYSVDRTLPGSIEVALASQGRVIDVIQNLDIDVQTEV